MLRRRRAGLGYGVQTQRGGQLLDAIQFQGHFRRRRPTVGHFNADTAGNLYGTTSSGGLGSLHPTAAGVVFKIDTTGAYRVLHAFSPRPTAKGLAPASPSIRPVASMEPAVSGVQGAAARYSKSPASRHLGSLSLYDAVASDLSDCFTNTPDYGGLPGGEGRSAHFRSGDGARAAGSQAVGENGRSGGGGAVG